MSYTSKYTGSEIDNLLDSIGGINATRTILWEGTLATKNQTVTFSESLENFDYLLIEPYYYTDGTKCRYGDITCLSTDRIKNNYGSSIIYPAFSLFDSDNWSIALYVIFSDSKNMTLSNINIQTYTSAGIKRIIGIKFAQASANGTGSALNPIGAIVPIMGTQAPKDHLVCDGSELNISEYKELADYFEAQFGNKNYFGGDGINTFAIPDLRNEFLRGYGDRTNEVGIHQDATEIPRLAGALEGNNKGFCIRDVTTDIWHKFDDKHDEVIGLPNGEGKSMNPSISGASDAIYASGIDDEGKISYRYTTRPTNVAVLFCIKYTESASSNSGSSYKEVELLSEPFRCVQGGGSHTAINQQLTLLDSILNYDEIVFTFCAEPSSGSLAGITNQRLLVSTYKDRRYQIILAVPTQNVRQLLCGFTADNVLSISSTCMTSGTGGGYFNIFSIKGIKY